MTLERKTPLRRGKPLESRGRVNRSNGKRKAKAYARNFGDEADAVRLLPCLCRGHGPLVRCTGEIVAAHVVSRGASGGRFDLVPLCSGHHDEQHRVGVESFARLYGLDLRAEADRIAVEHSAPLGIRGLAQRWAALADAQPMVCRGAGEPFGRFDTYELDALLRWVRRRMAAYLVGAASQGVDVAPLDWQAMGEWISLDLDIEEPQARDVCELAGWPS